MRHQYASAERDRLIGDRMNAARQKAKAEPLARVVSL
jgi:hypothetical protein